MQKNNRKEIKKHKLLFFISLVVILFSTDISNTIATNSYYNITDDLDCIRNQIALIIPCIIISINSCIHLFMYAKVDKNNLDT